MHDHPDHPPMLTDRALANFRRFIAANPNGPRHNPAGAFDSMPPQLSRRGIPLRAFEKGGAFDSAEAQSSLSPDTISQLLEFIKGANFPAGEAEELYRMIETMTEGPDLAAGGPDLATDARSRQIAAKVVIAREGRQLSRAAVLFPELSRIKR